MDDRTNRNCGKLYIVATPIGNLGDMTPRAVETLKKVDFIAAEDTRVTLKLLNHFGISNSLLSYYEHNRRESGEKILSRLLAGESCALVTDAGMPAVSDPGFALVELCAENGVEAVIVPGASAVLSAVALSGLDAARFCFEGFLSMNKRARKEHLSQLKNERRAMVFYEAPHKLLYTLEDLCKTLGEDRKAALCREMTKLHEECIRTTLGEACERYKNETPRGEFVLVVAGKAPEPEPEPDALALALALVDGGMSVRDASRKAAEETGVPKNRIYAELRAAIDRADAGA